MITETHEIFQDDYRDKTAVQDLQSEEINMRLIISPSHGTMLTIGFIFLEHAE